MYIVTDRKSVEPSTFSQFSLWW